MATVFTLFKQEPYEYLTIKRGQVFGNQIQSRATLNGVIKIRSGMTRTAQDIELSGGKNISDMPTIHAHPEDFATTDPIIGNGIAYGGRTYEIVGLTNGMNFANGELEHLTLTLKEADYAETNE